MHNESQIIPELDVRVLIPIERHRKLLKLFRELPVGKSFIFINDHDPLPLYYELRSIHGEVVGWEYLQRGGRDWKVKVTRSEASCGREFTDISTLLDLRKADKNDWKHVVFHRYGMMQEGDTMEIIAENDPEDIHSIFKKKFNTRYTWTYKKDLPGEYVIHITKKMKGDLDDTDFFVVQKFDLRPFLPAQRHEMFYQAFADIKPGEAFEFLNDHDPRPLYYQMEAESKEPFKWEYLKKGPEEWEVRVMKTRQQ